MSKSKVNSLFAVLLSLGLVSIVTVGGISVYNAYKNTSSSLKNEDNSIYTNITEEKGIYIHRLRAAKNGQGEDYEVFSYDIVPAYTTLSANVSLSFRDGRNNPTTYLVVTHDSGAKEVTVTCKSAFDSQAVITISCGDNSANVTVDYRQKATATPKQYISNVSTGGIYDDSNLTFYQLIQNSMQINYGSTYTIARTTANDVLTVTDFGAKFFTKRDGNWINETRSFASDPWNFMIGNFTNTGLYDDNPFLHDNGDWSNPDEQDLWIDEEEIPGMSYPADPEDYAASSDVVRRAVKYCYDTPAVKTAVENGGYKIFDMLNYYMTSNSVSSTDKASLTYSITRNKIAASTYADTLELCFKYPNTINYTISNVTDSTSESNQFVTTSHVANTTTADVVGTYMHYFIKIPSTWGIAYSGTVSTNASPIIF